ncbi:hypothetical protein [Parafrankia sp. FMc2]|uniref:hypothetical protein n=1 Tax=Parafrankia sp. FMc2 TaxID=3233196 RepID=UPI0034D5BEFF
MPNAVTVTRKGAKKKVGAFDARYTVEFSALPGKKFGPWDYRETQRDLTVSALLEPTEARALVLDAFVEGSATREVSR